MWRTAEQKCNTRHRTPCVLKQPREAEPGIWFLILIFYKNKRGKYCFIIFSVAPVPRQGRYDLEIRNSSYARDQAEFKCMMKQAGTGGLLHTSKVTSDTLHYVEIWSCTAKLSSEDDGRDFYSLNRSRENLYSKEHKTGSFVVHWAREETFILYFLLPPLYKENKIFIN